PHRPFVPIPEQPYIDSKSYDDPCNHSGVSKQYQHFILLEPDCNDDIILLGPLWLLWHGQWKDVLRAYLPLTI
ncbi:hypothetical protein, partial [Gemmiger formicilis]|uniref:hypothetical protein n=1 Tax=Gemmiger formicilis TaxID=745368 RepID=UPI00195E5814